MAADLPPPIVTRLEKVATDSGFDRGLLAEGRWLGFSSTQVPLKIWLTAHGDHHLALALSQATVLRALVGDGATPAAVVAPGASGAIVISDLPSLYALVRRAFQLSRTLPDELLHRFQARAAGLPRATEAERLVVQRVGQEVFREGLLDYWEGRCAITGLAVPELLRASHIKPWAACESDAERLDAFNGLLLAPHLDAVFDKGFVTVADDGNVLVSDQLSAAARDRLGLDSPLRVSRLTWSHHEYLSYHRERVFRGSVLPPTENLARPADK